VSIDSFGLRCPNPRGSVNNFAIFSAQSVEPMTPRQFGQPGASPFAIASRWLRRHDGISRFRIDPFCATFWHTMKALFDESVPLVGVDYAYLVVATILIDDDEAEVKKAIARVVGDRLRGFHWVDEGLVVRDRMLDCLIELGACAHIVVHHPTGRYRQEQARSAALRHLLPLVLAEGATELLIESRGTWPDGKDRAVLIDGLNALGRADVTYGWGNKTTPELWLPDAVCGAAAMCLSGGQTRWFERLQEAGVITEIVYIEGA